MDDRLAPGAKQTGGNERAGHAVFSRNTYPSRMKEFRYQASSDLLTPASHWSLGYLLTVFLWNQACLQCCPSPTEEPWPQRGARMYVCCSVMWVEDRQPGEALAFLRHVYSVITCQSKLKDLFQQELTLPIYRIKVCQWEPQRAPLGTSSQGERKADCQPQQAQ